MLIPNRNFNEKYYINRKKILQDFLKDEETETLKNIDDTENLVSKTKMILKGIVTGEYDYSIIKERLAEIDNDLVTDCKNYKGQNRKIWILGQAVYLVGATFLFVSFTFLSRLQRNRRSYYSR